VADDALRLVRPLAGVLWADEFPATRLFKLAVKVEVGTAADRRRGGKAAPPVARGAPLKSGTPEPLDDLDRLLLAELSAGLPAGPRPYAEVARRVGVPEANIFGRIRSLTERGVIRRIAAVVHDAKLGYDGNAMVAWQVPEGALERAGETAAARPEVSHAYARRTTGRWPFNLYTMIHARSREELEKVVEELRPVLGGDFRVLYTVREYTKRPPDYARLLGAARAAAPETGRQDG
jgi:DNA-binding Lrp family transcriptional regulator